MNTSAATHESIDSPDEEATGSTGLVLQDTYTLGRCIGKGRDGGGLRSDARAIARAVAIEDPALPFAGERGCAPAVLSRGGHHVRVTSPPHRSDLRLQHLARRSAVFRHGVPRGRRFADATDRRRRVASARAGSHRRSRCVGAGCRARAGHRAPRSQARKHLPGRAERGETTTSSRCSTSAFRRPPARARPCPGLRK